MWIAWVAFIHGFTLAPMCSTGTINMGLNQWELCCLTGPTSMAPSALPDASSNSKYSVPLSAQALGLYFASMSFEVTRRLSSSTHWKMCTSESDQICALTWSDMLIFKTGQETSFPWVHCLPAISLSWHPLMQMLGTWKETQTNQSCYCSIVNAVFTLCSAAPRRCWP